MSRRTKTPRSALPDAARAVKRRRRFIVFSIPFALLAAACGGRAADSTPTPAAVALTAEPEAALVVPDDGYESLAVPAIARSDAPLTVEASGEGFTVSHGPFTIARGEGALADAILVRHGVALQSVDVIGQILGHIANVIRSSDPEGAVDRIGMGDLKGRLTRKSVV